MAVSYNKGETDAVVHYSCGGGWALHTGIENNNQPPGSSMSFVSNAALI